MAEHELKTWDCYFDAVERGDKTFEVRVDDRDFQVGDVLVLRCWEPRTRTYLDRPPIRRRVTYIMGGRFGIEEGTVVMALAPDEVL